jgi:hypothetical protein
LKTRSTERPEGTRPRITRMDSRDGQRMSRMKPNDELRPVAAGRARLVESSSISVRLS